MIKIQYSQEISIKNHYDLIVCGGGLTGFATAISAARNGLKIAIIEKQGCLGGVATSGGVNHLLGAISKKKQVVGGLFEEITKQLIMRKEAIDPNKINRNRNPHGWLCSLADGVPFDGEAMKVLLDEMCLKNEIKIYYFTDIIDVICDKNKITQLICHNKSGLFALEAGYFADTTGDADIAYLSGCPTIKGREEDGLMTPASLEMHVDHVNKRKLQRYIELRGERRFKKLIIKLRKKGIWKFPYEIFISVQLNHNDVFMINTIRQVGIDGTDGDSITNGMIQGRSESMQLFRIMKKYFPGFKHARIRSFAPNIGIRETRRIIGKFVLKIEDLVKGTHFEDTIACSSYGWDLPDPKKPSYQPLSELKRKSKFTQIPYRSLLPQNISNLIVAGRCISVEREVLGPIRVMGPCIGMGQAAGIASEIAFKNNVTYNEINIIELKQKIIESGGILNPDLM